MMCRRAPVIGGPDPGEGEGVLCLPGTVSRGLAPRLCTLRCKVKRRDLDAKNQTWQEEPAGFMVVVIYIVH